MTQHFHLPVVGTRGILLQPLDNQALPSITMKIPGADLQEQLEDDGYETPYEEFSEENDACNTEPLFPPPLNLEKKKYRTSETHCSSSLVDSGGSPSLGATANDSNPVDIQIWEEDGYIKYKPLPPEPDEDFSVGLIPSVESTTRKYGIGESAGLSSSYNHRSTKSLHHMTTPETCANEQLFATSPSLVSQFSATENYEPIDHQNKSDFSTRSEREQRHLRTPDQNKEPPDQGQYVESTQHQKFSSRIKSNLSRVLKSDKVRKLAVRARKRQTHGALTPRPTLCRQPSTLKKMNELYAKRLLYTFFGFDLMKQLHLPLDNARLQQIQYYLTVQPHPDSVVNEDSHPLVSCVWLRNFIATSPHRLDFDRGRRRGLRLEDKSTQNVHRGFGLLWDFLEACGPNVSDEACAMGLRKEKNKSTQLEWFRVCTILSGGFIHWSHLSPAVP